MNTGATIMIIVMGFNPAAIERQSINLVEKPAIEQQKIQMPNSMKDLTNEKTMVKGNK